MAAAPRGLFARATAWAFVMDAGGQVATLAVSVVLAALLGPEAYGLVAMALVYVLLVQLVQQQGMQAAIIQRSQLSELHKDTAFWLVVMTSVVLTALSVALAGWWAGVNRTPELEPVLVALSALLPLRALTVVQEGVVRRSMGFRGLALRTLVSVLVGGAAGVWAAVAGWGVWALVLQQLTTAVVGLVILWGVSGWRPRWRFSTRAVRDLLGFSTGSFVSSLGVFVNNKADALLIGLFFGPVVVGVYRFAARLVEAVCAMALTPVQSVAFPALSRLQHDQARYDRRLLQLMNLSAWLTLPVLGVLAGSARTVVDLLGPEWEAAVWPLRLLCLVGLVRVVVNLDGPMLQARGMVRAQATATWVAATVSCAVFALAAVLLRDATVQVQVTGVAAARAGVYGVLVLAMHAWLLRRVTATAWGPLVLTFVPALVLGVLALLAGVVLDVLATEAGWSLVGRCLAIGAIGVLTTGVVLARNRSALLALRPERGGGTPAADGAERGR